MLGYEVLFAGRPGAYLLFQDFSLCAGVCAVEQEMIHGYVCVYIYIYIYIYIYHVFIVSFMFKMSFFNETDKMEIIKKHMTPQ